MAIIISQVRTSVTADKGEIVRTALKNAGIPSGSAVKAEIHKTSLDARNNSRIILVSSVWAELEKASDEKRICERFPFCSEVKLQRLMPEKVLNPDKKVVIAGFGPAGMFAGLVLAEYGFSPIIIERGGDVDERTSAVENFWNNAVLDP